MNVYELVQSASIILLAGSAAVAALQLTVLTRSVTMFASDFRKYLKRILDDEHTHHPMARFDELLVWEWRKGQWTMRSVGVTLEMAGPPPSRAGEYEGECIATRRVKGK